MKTKKEPKKKKEKINNIMKSKLTLLIHSIQTWSKTLILIQIFCCIKC